jgi:hypothetical protein
MFSVIASLYFIGFLALVNYLTSPGYMWFYYPAYAVLWWPMSMFLLKKNKNRIKLYSVIMTLATIAWLALINLLNSPNYIWFQYTIFYLIWWPVVMLLGKKAASVWFSIIGSLAIIAYHIAVYYIQTPSIHPWYLYIILPALWWPVCMALKKHLRRIWFLLFSLVVFAVYYLTLNVLIYPQYFWSMYLLIPEIIAVISLYYANKKKPFAYSVWVSSVLIVLFLLSNYMNSPNVIWAIYPVFAIIWWPLSVYFYKRNKSIKQA